MMKQITRIHLVLLTTVWFIATPRSISSNNTKPLPPKNYSELRSRIQNTHPHREKKIAVIIASYNNQAWYVKNLDSLLSQNYTNYHAYYIDDCSSDYTGSLVEAYLKHHLRKKHVTVIKNKTRVGALANIYNAIIARDDETIIVSLDGDDWFAHPNVLSLINKVYSTYDVWITYGQYRFYPSNRRGNCDRIPDSVIENNSFRSYRWVSSHLRTFYAKLFKKIDAKDLRYNDSFYPVAWDLAFMFPMLEMAHQHSCFISDELYVYNFANPINDERIRQKQQLALEKHIRALPRYSPIQALFS